VLVVDVYVYPTGVVAYGLVGQVNVWGIIDDTQTPNWAAVSTPQTPLWGVVSDIQTANWQNVTTVQTPTWANVPNTQPADWQQIAA